MPGSSRTGRLPLRQLGFALVLATVALSGCGERQSTFCSEFHTVDAAIAALRDAKASEDFTRVPDVIDQVASTYEAITPPPELQEDWMSAVEFFRHQAASARSLLSSGQLLETLPADDARYDRAFTRITEYAVGHCRRVAGTLVP